MPSSPPTNYNVQGTTGGDLLHDNAARGSGHQFYDGGRVPASASAESDPSSPSLLQQWSDLITRPIASCSGCLTQVEADRGDGVDNNVDAGVNTNHSLLDHDESIDSPTASRDIFSCSELDDGQAEDGVEVPTEQTCPICLHPMSPQDILYPIQCPSTTTSPTSCRYNFCTECMSALLKSSKEDYQEASDGSRRVKVRLQCPNCRAGYSEGIIEDVIQLRQEAAASAAIVDVLHDDAYLPTSTRLRNRSTASPRCIRQKRITNLIDKIGSMTTPSAVREQVLSTHYAQHPLMQGAVERLASREGSSSTVSFNDVSGDDVSETSLSEEVGTTATAAVLATPLFTRHQSLAAQRSSPQVLRTPIRRTRSLQAPKSSPLLLFEPPGPPKNKKNEASPRSVLDDFFADAEWNDTQSISTSKAQTRYPLCSIGTKKVCLEGINFASGDEGFFASAIDLDWCCSDYVLSENSIDVSRSSSRSARKSNKVDSERKVCGGFIDYGGVYHPCTNANRNSQQTEWEKPCQGCVFAKGTHTSYGNKGPGEEEQELYYDSDPGQHFNTTRSVSKLPPPLASSCDLLDTESSASRRTNRGKAKLRWRRRSRRQSKSSNSSDATASYLEAVHQRKENQQQEDQQAYLYDYFSRNDIDDARNTANANPMRTGVCSTKETDVGRFVQVSAQE